MACLFSLSLRISDIELRIQPAFIGYLMCVAIFSSWETCLCSLCALLIHETSHLLVGFAAGERILSIELTPFGGIMRYACGRSPSKGIRGFCVAAAGPLSNYLMLVLISHFPVKSAWMMPFMRCAMRANLAMLFLNLLPVLPLDGGRILFCIGYYLFPVSRLTGTLSHLGMLAGSGMVILTLYGMIHHGILNCSLLIIGIYLIICAAKSIRCILAENLYTVIQEHLSNSRRIRRIRAFLVPPDTVIADLIVPMEKSESAVFVFRNEYGDHWLGDDVLCRLILENPRLSIQEAFANLQSMQEVQENRRFFL